MVQSQSFWRLSSLPSLCPSPHGLGPSACLPTAFKVAVPPPPPVRWKVACVPFHAPEIPGIPLLLGEELTPLTMCSGSYWNPSLTLLQDFHSCLSGLSSSSPVSCAPQDYSAPASDRPPAQLSRFPPLPFCSAQSSLPRGGLPWPPRAGEGVGCPCDPS